MLRFLRLLRLAFWRAFQHDAFSIAKASAYSSILTFFPALLVVGSVLATSRKGAPYLREISYALSRILPAGGNTAMNFLRGASQRPVSLLITASLLTLWTASGVMVSWMEGFRRCYELPKIWGLVKERLISFLLVVFALIPMTFSTLLVAFGSKIETTILFYTAHEFSAYILLMWTCIRWLIATLTSIAVIALIYHNAVPRTQPWHTVHPGRNAGHRLVVLLHTAFWFLLAALCRLRSYLRIPRCRHCSSGMDVYGFPGNSHWCGVQRHAVSPCDAGKRVDRNQQPENIVIAPEP